MPAAVESISQGGYDPSFFQQLAQVEDRHFWFRARNRLISSLARKLTSGFDRDTSFSKSDAARETSSGRYARPVPTAEWSAWNSGLTACASRSSDPPVRWCRAMSAIAHLESPST